MNIKYIALIGGGVVVLGVLAYNYVIGDGASVSSNGANSQGSGGQDGTGKQAYSTNNLPSNTGNTSQQSTTSQVTANSVQQSGGTVVYQTNNGATALQVAGSGQTLNTGETLVSGGGISTPYITDSSGYITSLDTSAYGVVNSAPAAVNGTGTYQGIATTLGNQNGATVQTTSAGDYKVTTASGAVVYTNINPNGNT